MVASNAFMVEAMKMRPGAIGYMSIGAANRAQLAKVMPRHKAGATARAAALALLGIAPS